MSKDSKKIADFLFEIGTMRKINRAHYQVLLTNDSSDNIASHSFRVAMIGWLLAEKEGLDVNKVLKMCLLHDVGEVRTGDQNWIHKKYVKTFDEDVIEDQMKDLPKDFLDLSKEFKERKTPEAKLAKEADLIDQILLLKEYEHQGNKEASLWLKGKTEEEKDSRQFNLLQTDFAIELAKKIIEDNPSDWWKNSWSESRRK